MGDIQAVVGGMALDLIGKIEAAMTCEGDLPDDFEVTGALLFLTAEKEDSDGWTFTSTFPQTTVARLGLTEMAHNTVRDE